MSDLLVVVVAFVDAVANNIEGDIVLLFEVVGVAVGAVAIVEDEDEDEEEAEELLLETESELNDGITKPAS